MYRDGAAAATPFEPRAPRRNFLSFLLRARGNDGQRKKFSIFSSLPIDSIRMTAKSAASRSRAVFYRPRAAEFRVGYG
jgi:hypothetical protein